MLSQLRWRIAIPFAILVLLVSGITAYVANQPVCRGDPACLRITLWVGAGVMAITAVTLAFILSARITRPIKELTGATQRILSGDRHARIMRYGRD